MSNHLNAAALESLEPAPVWRNFAKLLAVPRPSKKEAEACALVRSWADGHGFAAREDACGNIVIEVPPSPGYEGAPITVLQGHIDMVCEKNAGTEHDFERDPIRPVLDTDADGVQIVRADGTTLGADNGIGLALAMAAATEADVVHGPLEILCTVDEEAGMSGAKALQPDFVKGRCMLNLDSEEDDVLYIGCAGGTDANLEWSFSPEPVAAGETLHRVSVGGLRGGHSGGDIHRNRANAVKLLVAVLQRAGGDGIRIVELSGGRLRNAIPREATATIAARGNGADALRKAATTVREIAVGDHGDTGCAIEVADVPGAPATVVLSVADTQRLLSAWAALPHGVLGVVPEIAGLVRTSNNLARAVVEPTTGGGGTRCETACLARSSSADDLRRVLDQIVAVGTLAGARTVLGNAYPGWQPNLDSPALATARLVYERLFGGLPKVTAIHAGLECGLIGERIPGMDMASFGPRIEGAHSPDERVYVASVQKIWKYLVAMLKELADG